MLGLNIFVVEISDESKHRTDIAHLSSSLDNNNFLPNGYFVDEEKYSRKHVGSSTPLSSGKKSKSKYEWNYLTVRRVKQKSHRENLVISSEDEEDNIEFNEDNDEQCTSPVNLS